MWMFKEEMQITVVPEAQRRRAGLEDTLGGP